MKKYILICTILAISSYFTAQEDSTLTLIPHEELLAKTLDQSFHYVYATFKNEHGEPLSDYERQQLNHGHMAMHYYQDEEGVVREVRIKPYTLEDKFEKANLSYQKYLLLETDRLIPVECKKRVDEIVAVAEDLDNIKMYNESLPDSLGMREHYEAVESYKDSLQYDQRAFSILHSCEWDLDQIDPILDIVSRDSYLASFHYFKLKDCYDKGLIPPEKWAGIQDSILITNGFDQIYGTAIRNGRLAKLENPYTVNSRRMEMDLPPIEQMLDEMGLDFDIEVHRMQYR